MGTFARILVMLSFSLMGTLAGAAQAELAGTWQGKLAVDARTSLTIQFNFAKQANGSYTAVLNSPDNGAIKNVAATGVTWDGTTVKLQVASLSGSYTGSLKAGKLEGQWLQQGSTLPLVLSPYEKPVMSKAAMDTLNGSWFGNITVSGNPTTLVLRFKPDASGQMQGTFSVPDQGLNDSPLSEIEFASNNLTLKLPRVNADLAGSYANNALSGTLKLPGPAAPPGGIPFTLKRGEYAAPVKALKLSSDAYAALNGKWQGKLEATGPQGQKIPLGIVLRFETNTNGQFVSFLDSPDQKATNIPVTEATFVDGKLNLKVDAVKGEYSATLTGKTLVGEWTQSGFKAPLTLTR